MAKYGVAISIPNSFLADCYLVINGHTDWAIFGGEAHTFINIREFMTPSVSSSVHGAGWISCGGNDNDWK